MLQRLKHLEENIAELNRFKNRFSLDDVQKDKINFLEMPRMPH